MIDLWLNGTAYVERVTGSEKNAFNEIITGSEQLTPFYSHTKYVSNRKIIIEGEEITVKAQLLCDYYEDIQYGDFINETDFGKMVVKKISKDSSGLTQVVDLI